MSIIIEKIQPKSTNQAAFLKAIEYHPIVLTVGYAGSGKTLLSLFSALQHFKNKFSPVQKIVVMRPLVETNIGEKPIGTLPGLLDEKIYPYFGGIWDNLTKIIDTRTSETLIKSSKIEFTALSLCRGRSFDGCFVIVDEAQNLTRNALIMILTRMHSNSKLVLIGDLQQSDLYGNDLAEVIGQLSGLEEVAICRLYDPADIQRNPLISKILRCLGGNEVCD